MILFLLRFKGRWKWQSEEEEHTVHDGVLCYSILLSYVNKILNAKEEEEDETCKSKP